jgi:hypothetical protein
MKKQTIRVLGRAETPVDRGISENLRKLGYSFGEIEVDLLRKKVAQFLTQMGSVVEAMPVKLAAFSLDKVSMAVEVTASGKVSLLGCGAEVEGKGGITFTWKRTSSGAK